MLPRRLGIANSLTRCWNRRYTRIGLGSRNITSGTPPQSESEPSNILAEDLDEPLIEVEDVSNDYLAAANDLAALIRAGNPSKILQSGLVPEHQLAATVIHGRASHQPYFHPRTHNIPVAAIHFRSYFPSLLDLATHFSAHAASALAIPTSRVVHLPTQRSLWTVLRGPFAHKKSQENFERRTHKRLIKAWDADQEVIERWITYMQLHPVAGVGMRIVRWHRAPVGVGRRQKISETVQMESMTSRQKMEDVAAQIVKMEMAAAAAVGDVQQTQVAKPSRTR